MDIVNSNPPKRVVSIFFPVKNELQNLPRLKEEAKNLHEKILELGITPDFFIHDNNSTDGSWDYIKNWADSFPLRAFRLRSDIGYQESLALAFDNAIGEGFMIIQSDLQDPPSVALEMIRMWANGAQSVVGIPDNRSESFTEKFGRLSFLFLFRKSSDFSKFEWFTDFYLLDHSLYKNYRSLPLVNQFIRGRLLEDFSFQHKLKYVRLERKKGATNFRFVKRYNLAMSALLLHSTRIIRRMTLLSVLLGVGSVFVSAILFALSITGVLNSSKIGLYGVGVLLFTNLTIVTVLFGVVLEYLLRIHKRLHISGSYVNSKSDLYDESF